jgi:exonuclease III
MRLSIATWNVNSVRLRFPLIERFVALHAPDVLCLQETKCPLIPQVLFAPSLASNKDAPGSLAGVVHFCRILSVAAGRHGTGRAT